MTIYSNDKTITHALHFLNIAIKDFPAEYFLQPPYVIRVSSYTTSLLLISKIVKFDFEATLP